MPCASLTAPIVRTTEMKAENIPLNYSGKWTASMCTPCDENGQGSPFAVYMYGAFMAEVTVDTKTGKTVRRQVHGGRGHREDQQQARR